MFLAYRCKGPRERKGLQIEISLGVALTDVL